MGMDQLLNKEERLPAFKLTIVQYAIVAILLVLLSGLWRLQVIGAQNYRTLAEQNRIRKVPVLAKEMALFPRFKVPASNRPPRCSSSRTRRAARRS